ncbi:hypothetical protein GPJ56_005546 [Histomonas meleagridis]|uniref:uncharacterized protein n=1 Tax=Histomonas meleagridis TaxID=135588 RepID=UPI00355972F5|nr:hypothetical protein GPJ56_005546 [Histomonas meleagridis]KAH0799598.1 hypothetical protein GO595_007666 [Histomonas meleagridis]
MSGKELLRSRVLSQINSWVETFNSVFIYSDFFSEEDKQFLKSANRHANISLIEISNKAEHIIGGQNTKKWYEAQPRFLPAMKDMWLRHPTAKWYLIGDDDTYFYHKNIIRRLAKYDSSLPQVISYFWCSWGEVIQYMEPDRDCHPFAQGGSGVIFSKTMMNMIGPHLDECNDKYNGANHAASMRVTVCMERLFGYNNWTSGVYIKPWRSGIHPNSPKDVIMQQNTWDAPGTFHQVNPREMLQIKKTHIVEFDDGFVDFAHFAFRTIPVELTRRRIWCLHFGYCIDNFGSHENRFMATSALETGDSGMSYRQTFEGNIAVEIRCDESMEESAVEVEDVQRDLEVRVRLAMKCPKKQRYYV